MTKAKSVLAKNDLLEASAGELGRLELEPVLTSGFELEKIVLLLEVGEEADADFVPFNVVLTVDLGVVTRLPGVVIGGRSHISRSK